MKIQVIRHVAFESLGNLEPILLARGCEISIIDAPIAPLNSIDPLASDLLIVLGGPIAVYDERDYPFIADELEIIKSRLAAGLPLLGICLGAQMIAKALGARVYFGGTKEIGWSPLELTHAGQQHPIRLLSGDRTEVLHWHGDTFDLPEDAVHLAASAVYKHQAFSYGSNVLALQFHPEVAAEALELWYVGHAAEISQVENLSVPKLRSDAQKRSPVLQSAAERFWIEWLDEIGVGQSPVLVRSAS